MKSLIIIFSFLVSIPFASAQSQGPSSVNEGFNLTIDVTNIESNQGEVFIGLYDSEGNWLKENMKGTVAEIKNLKCSTVLENIPAGTYAISIYHDQNSNKDLDTGWFGIPSEPYASSRGAKGKFGPPKWKDAVFEVKDNKTIEIKF